MKKLFICFALLAMTVLSGCSSKLMTPVTSQPVVPHGEEASITFFRPSMFGGGVQAPIAEEKNSGMVELVGICSTDTKIRHVVEPGRHVFVVGGESASLLIAEAAPGMNYYVRVSPRFGWWKARFEMVPVSPEDLAKEKVRKEIKECVLVSPNESAAAWFIDNKTSMENKLKIAKDKIHSGKDLSRYVMPKIYGIDRLY